MQLKAEKFLKKLVVLEIPGVIFKGYLKKDESGSAYEKIFANISR